MKPVTLVSLLIAGSTIVAGCGLSHPSATGPSTTSIPAVSSKTTPSAATQSSQTIATSTSAAVTSSSSRPAPVWEIGPMDFINASTGWVVGTRLSSTGHTIAEVIFNTKDGGKHWTRLKEWSASSPMPLPSNMQYSGIPAIIQLGFTSNGTGAAVLSFGAGACQAAYGILTTTDGGTHWTLQTQKTLMGEDGPLGISFSSTGPDWFANGSCAGASTTLSKSTDGGQQWTSVANLKTSNPSPSALSFYFTSPTNGYLVDSVNRYPNPSPSLTLNTTSDGGQHWTSSHITSQGLPEFVTGVSFINPQYGWVVAGKLNHASKIYHLQGGAWTALTTPGTASQQPPSLDLVNPQVAYLSHPQAGGSLWKTTNGGQNWTRLPFPSQ